jgi:hypothetical protein
MCRTSAEVDGGILYAIPFLHWAVPDPPSPKTCERIHSIFHHAAPALKSALRRSVPLQCKMYRRAMIAFLRLVALSTSCFVDLRSLCEPSESYFLIDRRHSNLRYDRKPHSFSSRSGGHPDIGASRRCVYT